MGLTWESGFTMYGNCLQDSVQGLCLHASLLIT